MNATTGWKLFRQRKDGPYRTRKSNCITLRQALKALRRVDWGETGTMSPVMLSDGSMLSVCNATTDDGQGILPGVHVAVREWVRTGKTRTYKL